MRSNLVSFEKSLDPLDKMDGLYYPGGMCFSSYFFLSLNNKTKKQLVMLLKAFPGGGKLTDWYKMLIPTNIKKSFFWQNGSPH